VGERKGSTLVFLVHIAVIAASPRKFGVAGHLHGRRGLALLLQTVAALPFL
jgi:hypothetical protein